MFKFQGFKASYSVDTQCDKKILSQTLWVDSSQHNKGKVHTYMIKFSFQNGPNRDENGEWRRLHNEELHSLYRSPNIVRVIKKIEMGMACS